MYIIAKIALNEVETSEYGKKIIFICNEWSARRCANALLQGGGRLGGFVITAGPCRKVTVL